MSRLSEKVTIVTGASKGIGAGIAVALRAEGARVAVNYSFDRKCAEGNVAAGTFEGAAGAALAEKTPRGQLGRVTDIAPLTPFLASDESAWITGEIIRASGGLVVAS